MNDLLNMLNAMILAADNYDDRKVAEKEQVEEFKISSCYTSDMGYETAVIYKNEVYPVQRYISKEECLEGHNKWIEWAKNKPKSIPYLQFDNKTIENVDIEEAK